MRNFQEIGRSQIYSQSGLAATSHPFATLEAISILKEGGNAIDAAIAASVVLSVVEPQSTGIGGDCFALIHRKGDKAPVAINGSGKAAAYADPSFFEKNGINELGINSVHSVTIPGCVDAWSKMSKNYGKLPWKRLFDGAINYAKNGFPVMEKIASDWEQTKDRLKLNETTSKTFLKNNSDPYKLGEIFTNPNLAKTLELIATEGKEVFYEGPIAKDIVLSLNKAGGFHELKDLKEQDTLIQEPIKVNYRDKTLFQCPPNNQGITALIIMKILEKFDISQYPPMSVERFHLEAEATKLAYYLRDQLVADNSNKAINYESYLTTEYLEKMQNLISLDKCLVPPSKILDPQFSPDTVYLTVVDKEQNAVSFINSIFHSFGSCITTENTGIVLHNRGACFTLQKGHPNCIAPGKRPMHTIMPGMIYKDGEFFLSYGVMGGQYQPVGHIQFLNNFLEYGMTIQESLNFPRAFNYAGTFELEQRVPKEIEEKLKEIGHKTKRASNPLGGGQAIGLDLKNNVFLGGSDPRKDGCALGF